MSPQLKIKVARNGKEMGEFTLFEIKTKIATRELLLTDDYWRKGMGAWAKLEAINDEIMNATQSDDREIVLGIEKIESERAALIGANKDHENKNTFTCHCCCFRFKGPINPESLYTVLWLEAALTNGVLLIGSLGLAFLYEVNPLRLQFSPMLAPLIFILIFCGFSYAWFKAIFKLASIFFKAPYCPNCKSTNFSREAYEKTKLFDEE